MILKSLGIAAVVFVFASTMATAGVIHKRQKRQRVRIDRGMRSGELTPGEAAALHSEQQDIQAKRERALADGKVTKGERRSIRREQNEASKDIRHDKRDSDYNP